MEIKVHRNQLNQAALRIQGAISDRNFSFAGIKATDKAVIVSISDQVIAVFSRHPCEVVEEGHTFVQAKLFTDVIRELQPGIVQLRQIGSYLEVRAGERGEFLMKIPTIEQAWQDLEVNDSVPGINIDASKLQYLINQVELCVVPESSRNYATVAYLHRQDPGSIRLVASDGFRLSYSELLADLPADFLTNGVCLSKRVLSELLRLCKEGFESVRVGIYADQSTMLVEAPDLKLYIRLSTIRYPKYQGVLPQVPLSSIVVGRTQLQTVAKRVLLASDRTRALQLCFADSSLTLSSKTVGSSEGRESIELSEYHGPELELVVNGKFLTEVFAIVPSGEITMSFRGKEQPVVFVPNEEPTGCSSMHVLVPIHESESSV